MRRDDQPFDLLVGVVGQREDDPVRMRARLAWRATSMRRTMPSEPGAVETEQAVALRIIALDRLGEVDRLRVERNANRFDGLRRAEAGRKHEEQDKMAQDQTARRLRRGSIERR